MATRQHDPRRYDPLLARPGNEAFRRYREIHFRRGRYVVTHPVPAEPGDHEDALAMPFPVFRGGGASGAPLPPAPAPDQLEE